MAKTNLKTTHCTTCGTTMTVSHDANAGTCHKCLMQPKTHTTQTTKVVLPLGISPTEADAIIEQHRAATPTAGTTASKKLRMAVDNACANHTKDGCLIHAACHTANSTRCGYFEKAILPLLLRSPEHKPIVDEYLAFSSPQGFRLPTELREQRTTRTCKRCGLGPLPPRHRLCDACKGIQRRELERNRKRRGRSA